MLENDIINPIEKTPRYPWYLVVVIVILLAGLSYGGYRYYGLMKELTQIQGLLASTTADKNTLTVNLASEQKKNDFFANQISQISGTVGTLEKLSKTDRELLQKYSKVYFLSDNYVPSQLIKIDEQYLKDKNKSLLIHAKVEPYLDNLIQASINVGANLEVASAFRSFDEQASVKSAYKITYGSGANKFSADQGYSEHQLGTTIDFITATSTFATFEKTPANKWLLDNAYKYGFVLSFPKANQYYQYEPWHWRFVGVALATKLHNENKYFYDLTQREIDQYLVSIFD